MDWITILECLKEIVLSALAIFGVICIIALTYSVRVKIIKAAAAASQPEPKQGRVVLREVVEGMNGMSDSYIAEIRDHGGDDMRFHVYDVNGNLIMETPVDKCRDFGVMIAVTNVKVETKGAGK